MNVTSFDLFDFHIPRNRVKCSASISVYSILANLSRQLLNRLFVVLFYLAKTTKSIYVPTLNDIL